MKKSSLKPCKTSPSTVALEDSDENLQSKKKKTTRKKTKPKNYSK